MSVSIGETVQAPSTSKGQQHLHDAYDYNTSVLKSAIKNGEAKPATRRGSMTIFPLGLPQGTRDRLASLSLETGESMASIIRQAINKILDEGACGVEQVTSNRAQTIATRQAAIAKEKANRALAREIAQQEREATRAASLTEKAAQKALPIRLGARTETVPVQAQLDRQGGITDQPVELSTETKITDQPQTTDQPGGAAQLDRPVSPSPAHIWVRGGTNRWGGYWRAPRGSKTTAVTGPREPGSDDDLNN